MAKKQKPIDAGPSKAYLVSFGDTMTALLAFFIVLNSLATEQTGANMYAGTGSFVNAFAKSGMPGGLPGNRSEDMIQQEAQAPIYALAKNLDKNQTADRVGPDDTDEKERVVDRDKEEFQKFLAEIQKKYGVDSNPPVVNQVVFDSFEVFDRDDGSLSEHAIQLAAEMIPKLRQATSKLEIIVWANMPSKNELDRKLVTAYAVKAEIAQLFWIKPAMSSQLKYTVKPWLFSDAKRPVISFVMSETR